MVEGPAKSPTPRDVAGIGLARAALLGLIAAGVGAGLDLAIGRLLGTRFVLMPWLTGLAVGLAIRRGRGSRRGPAGQFLAVAFTYAAVVAAHLPALPDGVREELDLSPFTLLVLATLPIQRGTNDLFGLAMILLGLVQAWRINRKRRERPAPPPVEEPADLNAG